MKKTLGYPYGSIPKIHLKNEDGKAFCGIKTRVLKHSGRLKEEEWKFVCSKCLKYSKKNDLPY